MQMNGAIQCYGGATISKNVCILESLYLPNYSSNIVVNGNIQSSNFYASGATKLMDTLYVKNTVLLDNDVVISKNLKILKDISIFGKFTLQNDISCQNIESFSQIINGNVNISNDSVVNGNSIINKNLTVQKLITTNELNVSNSIQTMSIRVQSNIICNDLLIPNKLQINDDNCIFYNTTDSVSFSTGSVILNGGIGIKGSCNILGKCNASSIQTSSIQCKDFSITNSFFSSSVINTFNGNVLISGSLKCNQDVYFNNNTTVTNINVDGIINSSNNIESNSIDTGSIITLGGIGISGSCNIGKNLIVNGDHTVIRGNVSITNTTDSVSFTSGSFFTAGGAAISGNTFIKGALTVQCPSYFNSNLTVFGKMIYTNTTDSESTVTGSIVLLGGIGISKNVYIGNDLSVNGNLNLNGNLSLLHANISGKLLIQDTTEINGLLFCSQDVTFSGKNTTILGNIIVKSNVESINYYTGCTILQGGMGISGNLNINGTLFINKDSLFNGSIQSNNFIGIGPSYSQVTLNQQDSRLYIDSQSPGIRICNTKVKNQRYLSSLDLFTYGSSFIENNFEALQILNDVNGNFMILTRSTGGLSRENSLTLQSSISGAKITLNPDKTIDIQASINIVDAESKESVTIQVSNETESYTLILPKSAPPKNVESILACDSTGNLYWKVL